MPTYSFDQDLSEGRKKGKSKQIKKEAKECKPGYTLTRVQGEPITLSQYPCGCDNFSLLPLKKEGQGRPLERRKLPEKSLF